MRKIDTTKYKEYTVIMDGSVIIYNRLPDAIKLFNERQGRCELRGNRPDGTFAILDKKI